MAVDVSSLRIEVTTTGIKDAQDALGRLSRTANTTATATQKLTDNLTNLMRASGSITGSTSGLTAVMGQLLAHMQSASAAAQATAQALAQAAQGMNNLTHSANQASGALQRKSRWGGVVETTLKAMATAALAYVGINFMMHSVKAADSWMTMTAKLKLATGSMENARFAQQELFELAQKMRVPVEDLTKLFTRLAPTMRNNGKSFGEAKDMVEGVSLALKLNGATAGEASSVMLQFSQAMQKGRLDGAEFNAIAENGSLIMRALEKETGKSAGELKKMGSEGKLSFELIQRAMAKMLPQWRKDFAELPVTVEDAGQRIKNAWFKAMGEMSEQSGLNKGLVEALSVIEKLIPTIRDELVGAFVGVFKWIGENRNTLWEIWSQIKGIVTDVWELFGALSNVGRAVLGVGENFSVIGFAVYAVRVAFAGLQDGMVLIGAAILKAGSYIWDALFVPLTNIATGALKIVVEGFSNLTGMLAKGADAVGLEGLATSLKSASDFGDNIAQTIKGVQDGFKGVGTAMAQQASEAYNMIANGEGAVARVLAGEQQVTMEVVKRAKFSKEAWEAGKGPVSKASDPKAQKDHEQAIKAANSELEKQVQLYREQAFALMDFEKYGLDGASKYAKLKEDQTEIEYKLTKATDDQAKKILETALSTNKAYQEILLLVESKKALAEAERNLSKSQEDKIAAAEKEAQDLQDKINNYGKAKGAVEELALVEAKRTLAEMDGLTATAQQIAQQERLVEALQKVADAKAKLGQFELEDKIGKLFDRNKVADFGNAFGEAFGKAGKAVDKVGKSLDQYKKKMVDNERLRKEIAQESDPIKRHIYEDKLRQKEREDTLDMYGDMAGAVKSFFDEKTFAYKAFDTVEKTMRALRLAEEFKEFATKSGLLQAFTSLFVANKATEATAEVASVGTTAVAETAKQTMFGTTALAGALALPFPANLPAFAIVAAMLAAIGVAVSGASGGASAPSLSETRQKTQGAGTVLGDSEAKSESIKNSLDRMRDNSNVGLEYSASMVMYLRNIEMNIGGLTASIARVTGLTTGKNFGIATGEIKSARTWYDPLGIFGSKVTRNIQDTGLAFNGTVTDFQSGAGVQQYVDVQETKKRLFGGSKTKNFRQTQAVSDELNKYVGDIFGDISNSISATAGQLGMNAQDAQARLSNFRIVQEVSLKDLKGEDLEKTLQSIFSASADDMAMMIMPQFTEFQKAGEGYFETITRVATGTELAKDALSKLGVSMLSVGDLAQKAGEIDVELVRESLMRHESGTSLVDILKLLDGSMEDLVNSYEELTRIRNVMQSMGVDENKLSLDLIRGAGGINELADAFDTYTENFFSSQEQTAMKMNQVTMEFSRLGIAVPKSRQEFRSLVTELMQGGEAGQEMAGRILALSDSFSEAMDMYDETSGQKITDARDALSEAYDRESEALENTREKMQQFADSLREFKESLIMGDLSPLSTMEKYQTALSKFNDVSDRALAGDVDAIEQFQKVSQELLKYSRDVNASGEGYMADFQSVLAATDALAQYTQGQADEATTQLEVLKSQVERLISIDESTKTVAQAMAELLVVMGGGASLAVTDAVAGINDEPAAVGVDGTTIDASTVATTSGETAAALQAAQTQRSTESLLAEIQGLRAEVAALRQEQKDQTGALIGAEYGANEQAANTVVDGYKKALEDAAYAGRVSSWTPA